MKAWIAAAAMIASVLTSQELSAQADGLVAFPATYHVQFENQWVRLVRVRLAGHANLGMHSHPEGFMFHVYVNDAEPIVFNHDGAPYDITRPPVTARSYRIGRATPEVHAVVNPSAGLSDYLRVEYKTRGMEQARRRVDASPIGTVNATSVEHIGEQSRVTRVTIAPGASTELVATAGLPALLVYVTDAMIAEGSAESRAVKVGTERFLAPDSQIVLRNTGTVPVQLLRFDFLTPPDA